MYRTGLSYMQPPIHVSNSQTKITCLTEFGLCHNWFGRNEGFVGHRKPIGTGAAQI